MADKDPKHQDHEDFHSTRDLKKVLGKGELMGIAIGQIIGAGIMSMIGIGIAMTGRSVNLSFMIAAVFTIFKIIPIIFIASCVRLRGGQYTQMGLFAGDKFAGAYSIIYVFTNLSLSMYALSFADYFIALVPGVRPTLVAICVATLFFLFNFFGVDIMAKVQNVLVLVLVLSLLLFAFYGVPQVDLATYFSNADGLFMAGGFGGMMSAAAYLAFATAGAQVILNVSAECKNPKQDIPFVIILSTLLVAVLYAVVSTVAAGVLSIEEVANQPLTLVAAAIFPRPVYYFFIVGGAMFALATTLNSQIMSVTKPMMQACEDGWFPRSLASLHPRFRTPWKLLVFYFLVTIIPILLGLDISQISSIVLIVGYVVTIITTVLTYKLPTLFPEQWDRSAFHIPKGALITFLVVATAMTIVQFFYVANQVTVMLLFFNIAVIVFAFVYAQLRYRTGKVRVTISYDLE